jgi:hypothetical protein
MKAFAFEIRSRIISPAVGARTCWTGWMGSVVAGEGVAAGGIFWALADAMIPKTKINNEVYDLLTFNGISVLLTDFSLRKGLANSRGKAHFYDLTWKTAKKSNQRAYGGPELIGSQAFDDFFAVCVCVFFYNTFV